MYFDRKCVTLNTFSFLHELWLLFSKFYGFIFSLLIKLFFHKKNVPKVNKWTMA